MHSHSNNKWEVATLKQKKTIQLNPSANPTFTSNTESEKEGSARSEE